MVYSWWHNIKKSESDHSRSFFSLSHSHSLFLNVLRVFVFKRVTNSVMDFGTGQIIIIIALIITACKLF